MTELEAGRLIKLEKTVHELSIKLDECVKELKRHETMFNNVDEALKRTWEFAAHACTVGGY